MADGADGRRRWEAAGRPIVPSLLVDGHLEPVLHVSQVADALGLAWRSALPSSVLAADAVELLAAWEAAIAELDLGALLAPTPARGRSLRNLTVNVHHPFDLLPGAWSTGSFPWDPEADDEREATLATAEAVRGYAAGVGRRWRAFVEAVGADLDRRDPGISSPRGATTYAVLLDTQRWHVAYHLRQLEQVLDRALMPPLQELALPTEVF